MKYNLADKHESLAGEIFLYKTKKQMQNLCLDLLTLWIYRVLVSLQWHFSTVGDWGGRFSSWDTLPTDSATSNTNFTLSVTCSLKLLSCRPSKSRNSCRTSHLCPPPWGLLSLKVSSWIKYYATAIDDFHTAVSEAATRCPPWQSGSPLWNV